MIEHVLSTTLLGDVTVLVPGNWPPKHGFIIRVGTLARIPLVRIQSRCAYGEVFGSRHCDCRAQLEQAASQIRSEGGLVIYLDQEGRGAGISAKAAAYRAAQHEQIDTFTHYESSGLPSDLRTYGETAGALLSLGITSIRLLTNNPDKVESLRRAGLHVRRVPLVVQTAPEALPYLEAKRSRGHLL
jgi:3,4-dihydroxy 2-butanone 4-phosphate synthase/GTP cyclohydrolase II